MGSDLTPGYIAQLQKMSGQLKLKTAIAMYWSARKLKAAGLRHLHPDWTEGQVQQKVKELSCMQSPELFQIFT